MTFLSLDDVIGVSWILMSSTIVAEKRCNVSDLFLIKDIQCPPLSFLETDKFKAGCSKTRSVPVKFRK